MSGAHRWTPPQTVRAVAIGVVRSGDAILVMAVREDDGALKGWRPLGGCIELGERAVDALRREMLEELGEAIADPVQLCVLENIFEHNGARGHEIVFVFETSFVEPRIYEMDRIAFVDGSSELDAAWVELAKFREGRETLFPSDLLAHLR
jgi:ADP-ribose pyrophosphatase YjhB (NUDIX family)